MIRVRELSAKMVAVAEELNLPAASGKTYIDIIGTTVEEARAVVEALYRSCWQKRHVEGIWPILDRLQRGDDRVSLVDENGDRIDS